MNFKLAQNVTYALLRIVTGLLYFQAGSTKALGWFGGIDGQGGTPPFFSQIGIGGWMEFVGGIAVMFGLFTRPVAFVLSGEMAVAYWQFHAPDGAWPIVNQGIPAVLFCFIFLYMAAQGAGEWSIDKLIRTRRLASAGP